MGPFKGKVGNAHARCHVTGWYGVIRNHIKNTVLQKISVNSQVLWSLMHGYMVYRFC